MSNIVAADELRQFIERLERLEEEKKGLSDDIKEVFAESKSRGYDAKTMRKVLARRKMERHHAQEADMLFATYCAALGMQLAFDL